MKKVVCLLLTLILTLSLCACGESKPAEYKGLQVGFGRISILPDYEVQLSGGAATRISTGIKDQLYLTCVAIRENGETYIIGTMDFLTSNDVFVEPAKLLMSSATGVPAENILLNATHTHAAPAIRSNGAVNVDKYREDFNKWAEKAAKEAIADLSPAEIWYGSTEAEGMAWVRHYKMADGTYAGPNYGSFSSGIVGHVSDADVQMQLIKFVRAEEGKKDVVMMNYPAHATMTQTSTDISADFPGPARDYVEANSDTLVAYFIAAGGDQVPNGKVAEENFSSDYKAYGAELGRIAVECMENLTKLETTGITELQRTYVGKSNKEKLDLLAEAKAVEVEWNTVGRGTPQGAAAAKAHGFSSVYEVSAVIDRANAPETNEMKLRTLAIGDVSFLFAPYEMFGSTAIDIREKSPYPMTFIITCAQDHEGYLPSELGWEIDCYEVHVSKFERGTAEKLAEEYVSMLTEMKGNG